MEIVKTFLSSIATTARLLLRRELHVLDRAVGQRLRFADGSTSRIYRETVRGDGTATDPATLVVEFRLRVLGHSKLGHALFRVESLANTPLFAGFPGFVSKLWLTDEQTDVYRGIYEWDGAEEAISYATVLAALLRRLSAAGSVQFQVERGRRRDDYVADLMCLD